MTRRAQRRARAKLAQAGQAAATPVMVDRPALKISPELRARAKIARRKPQAETAIINPFKPAEHPLAAMGGAKLAMDEAPGIGAWADCLLPGYNGGLGYFVGFPQLALQAQVPEIRRMVEIIATEATRKWIKIQASGRDKADEVKAIEAAFAQFRVRDLFRRALEGDGYFGRGHLFVDLGADGAELATSIGGGTDAASTAKVAKGALKGFRTVEAMWAYPSAYNTQDPLAPDWYKPATWLVQGKAVHRTRLLTFVSREVPDLLKPAYSFGGVSLSQLVKPVVDIWLRTRGNVADLVNAFSVMVLLTQMGNTLGVADVAVMERVETFNDLRDNHGTFVVNKETEDFKNISAPIAGLDGLQAQAQEHMASVCGIPLVKLLGISPTGMNASTEGELRVFYDWIHAYQEEALRPNLTTVLALVQLHLFGKVDPEITFSFEPLWSMSDKEIAEVREINARTASTYADGGVILPGEERQRLADDPESMYPGLDMNAEVEPPADENGAGLADPDEPGDDTGSAVMGLFDRVKAARHDRSEPGRDAGASPRGRASEAA